MTHVDYMTNLMMTAFEEAENLRPWYNSGRKDKLTLKMKEEFSRHWSRLETFADALAFHFWPADLVAKHILEARYSVMFQHIAHHNKNEIFNDWLGMKSRIWADILRHHAEKKMAGTV